MFKSTRFSRSNSAFLAFAVFLAGCAGGAAEEVGDSRTAGQRIEDETVEISVASPARNDLGLLKGRSRVQVGAPVDLAFDVFPPPPRASEFSELPERLSADQFESRVWETNNEGFGAIYTSVNDVDRVVLALRTFDRVNANKVREIIEQYARAEMIESEEPTIPEGSRYDPESVATYWFHEDDDQRLMIAVTRNLDEEKMLIIAVGEKQLMDLLRMDPVSAREDYRFAARNVEQQTEDPIESGVPES